MTELQLKYNSLDTTSQKEVRDFIDFLAGKMKRTNANESDYKKGLLQVSTWSDNDTKNIKDATALIQFKPQEW